MDAIDRLAFVICNRGTRFLQWAIPESIERALDNPTSDRCFIALGIMGAVLCIVAVVG